MKFVSVAPPDFNAAAWAKACVALLVGVAVAVRCMPAKSPQKKAS